MSVWRKISIAALGSWASSVTLGLLFAIAVSEDHSPKVLLLPGIVPVALIGSTVVAIAMAPLVFWSLRSGKKNWWRYAPVLWIALAAYILFAIPKVGHYGPHGLFLLAILGVVVLGFVPEK